MTDFLAGDVFEVRVEGITAANTRWVNVLHYAVESDITADEFEATAALASAVFGIYEAEVMPVLSDQCNLLSTRAAMIYPNQGVPAVNFGVGSVPGGVASESLPPDVAAVSTKRTSKPGRSFLGRMYTVGITEDDVSRDLILTTAIGAIATALEHVLEDQITATDMPVWNPGVFSRKHADLMEPAADCFAKTVQAETDRVMRNMRSRGLKYRYPVQGGGS